MSEIYEIIHGFKGTDVACPCRCFYGMLERIEGNKVKYTCWNGRSSVGELKPGDEGYVE